MRSNGKLSDAQLNTNMPQGYYNFPSFVFFFDDKSFQFMLTDFRHFMNASLSNKSSH